MAELISSIARHISGETGREFVAARWRDTGGGCINRALVLEGGGRSYFVKCNDAARLSMFEAELAGLRELAAAAAVRVPQPVCAGVACGSAYLVLEYLELDRTGAAMETLGYQLARLHRHTAEVFGWARNNTIGSTPQDNTPAVDWVEFWRERRLGFQLRLAAAAGGSALRRKGEKLLAVLDHFFVDYRPVPSLLHGDLWSGNAAALPDGQPVIFDPAVYYGDRETDIAMTELFGGFGTPFYDAYRETWPLDPGYSTRRTLYNLYHVLNHLNLFGGGYGAQAERMIDSLLAEV
jgi:protein-ribulosamine 3-kinase